MTYEMVTIVAYAAWLPAAAVLFRKLGPSRATLFVVFASFLLLPRMSPCPPIFDSLSINKRTISGLALLLGVLVCDPRALVRGRPRALDLPMIAYLLMPLVSSWAVKFEHFERTLEQLWSNAFEWGMPYLMGRLYFGDRDGPRRISVAIVVAGLCYVPICLYEMAVGPRYYVLGLVYGQGPYSHMVERLGGWRPEGFLTNGIELTTWMAMASTMAAWLWLRKGWTPPVGLPAWAPALALSFVTIACRGAYAYLTLGLGLATAGLSHALNTRVLILALSLVPPSYLIARASGLWDGQSLVQLADKAGSGSSVGYRIRAEDLYVKKVAESHFVLGYGGNINDSAIFDWFAQNHLWPDGWWIHQLRASGLVGLALFALAFFLAPAWLGLDLPAGRSRLATPGALAWGLALFLILHLYDSLHNMAFLTPSPLVAGSLVGLFLARRSSRLDVPPPISKPSDARIPLLVAIFIVASVEILGRSPKASPPILPPPPIAPAPEAAPADPLP